MKLCGTERPKVGLRWRGNVNTKTERRALSIITHNFAGKLFCFSYLEKRRLTSQWCTVYNISLNKAGSIRITCIEARSRNHCCHLKAILITYAECVCSVSYSASKTHLFCTVLYCRLWPVVLCHTFPHCLLNGTILRKKSCWTCNVCFDLLYNFCLEHFLF
jgi:hypothetical protein